MEQQKHTPAIKYACFINSVHTLLVYLLRYGKEQFLHTYFFVSEAISEDVRKQMSFYQNMPNNGYLSGMSFIKRLYVRLKLRFTTYKRWPFLKDVPIYGFDHLWYSSLLLHNRKMTVIEDGLANYNENLLIQNSKTNFRKLKSLLFGKLIVSGEYGYSDLAEKVVLTGISPVLDCVKHKAEVIDLQNTWNQSADKDFINTVFGLTKDIEQSLRKKKVLILGQPYNDEIGDQALSEIYFDIIEKYNREDVVIKPHPRDSFDYKHYFPDVTVLDVKAPAELFALNQIIFEDIYTINSTAIFSFPDSSRKHLLGYQCHPALIALYGTN